MDNQGELVDLPAALFQLTTLVFLGVAAWTGLIVVLASWRRTRTIAMALTPQLLRAAVFTTFSGTLVISPAQAAGDLDGLPYPDRSTTVDPIVEPAAVSPPEGHVVKTGESLWSIATGTLPPDATPARVARTSADWYDANRQTIGPDPDLILPGQHLAAPADETTR